MQYYSRLACEQGEGKERGKEKREPVELPKDFDFHMPVSDVMLTHSFTKLEDLPIHQIFNSLNPVYLR